VEGLVSLKKKSTLVTRRLKESKKAKQGMLRLFF
jgi:hypothetical protein